MVMILSIVNLFSRVITLPKSKSLFGNIDYFIDSNLKLSFGMRWKIRGKLSYSNKESFNPANDMNGGKISLTKSLEDLTLYVSAAKGYKQGGFNLGIGLVTHLSVTA